VTTRKWTRVQSQILVWCGDERLEIGYDASSINVPPINEVAKVGIRSPYRLPSATTKSGVPLPGTVLVEDVIVQNEDGGWKKIFDVSDLCGFLERDMPELFARGFQIVSDPDEVKVVQIESRPAYESSLDARARDVLALELTRRKRFEDSGQPAPPGSNEKDVVWAIRHQQSRASRRSTTANLSTADIYSALAGHYIGDVPTGEGAPNTPDPASRPASQTEPQAPERNVSAASMIEEADELGIKLTPADLKGLIRGDRDTFDYVGEKLKLKRADAA
jgi:hypothetical protein